MSRITGTVVTGVASEIRARSPPAVLLFSVLKRGWATIPLIARSLIFDIEASGEKRICVGRSVLLITLSLLTTQCAAVSTVRELISVPVQPLPLLCQ